MMEGTEDNGPTGQELVEEIRKDPSLDEVMRRDPTNVTEADLRSIVQHEREARALFIKGQADRKAKRRGQTVADAEEEETE